jgi:hypothetical protein
MRKTMILAAVAVIVLAAGAAYAQQGGCDVPAFFGTDNAVCYNGRYYVIDGPHLRLLDPNMRQVDAVQFYTEKMYGEDAERLRDSYGTPMSPDTVDQARLMVNQNGVFVMHAGRVHSYNHNLDRIESERVFQTPRYLDDDRRFDPRRDRYRRGYRTPDYYYPPGYGRRAPGTYYYDDRHDPRRETPPGFYSPPGRGTAPGFYDPPRRPGWYRAPGQGTDPGWYDQPTPPGWYESPEEREERQRRERHRNNPFRW